MQFFLDFFCFVTSDRKLRKSRMELLSRFPQVFVLRQNYSTWDVLPQGRNVVTFLQGRDILRIWIRFLSGNRAFIEELLESERCPPPKLPYILVDTLNNLLVLLCSIDSGTGTTKLIGRSLRSKGSKSTFDIILFSTSQGYDGPFSTLKHLAPLANEIKTTERDGIQFNSKHYDVIAYHVSYFKLMYSISGCFGSNRRYPRFYCGINNHCLDMTQQ